MSRLTLAMMVVTVVPATMGQAANDSPTSEVPSTAGELNSSNSKGGLVVVELTGAALALRTSVLTCQGLYNRKVSESHANGGPAPPYTGVYTILGGSDATWLEKAEGISNYTSYLIPPDTFLEGCLGTTHLGVAKGYIRFNATAQKAAFPCIATLAGVLDSVPLEDGDPVIAASGARMTIDALKLYGSGLC
jgi:hypothetical protein